MASLEDLGTLKKSFKDVDLLCPICHNVIDVYNNDFELSIYLHSQEDTHVAFELLLENNKSRDSMCETSGHEASTSTKEGDPLYNFSAGIENIDLSDTETISHPSTTETKLDLNDLFSHLPLHYGFHNSYITVIGDRLYCSLCNLNIVTVKEDNLLPELQAHIEGSHQLQYVKQFVKYFPKNQIEDENVFGFQEGKLICKLCNIKIPISHVNVYETASNVLTHLNGRKHNVKLVKVITTACENVFLPYSSDMHSNLSAVPTIIKEYKQFIEKRGKDFYCTLCDLQLQCPYNTHNLQEFSQHLLSTRHNQNVKNFENERNDIWYAIEKTFSELKKLLNCESVPQIINRNKQFIEKIGDSFNCTLCDIHILDSSKSSKNKQKFFNHLTCAKHQENMKEFRNKTYNNLCKIKKRFLHLKDLFKNQPLPNIIKSNKQFIDKFGDKFYCTLCFAKLQTSSNLTRIIFEFKKHLNSARHQQRKDTFRQKRNDFLNENCFSDLKELMKDQLMPDIIEKNKMFLHKKENCVYCKECDAQLQVLNNPINTYRFIQHFKSKLHEKNTMDYVRYLCLF